MVTKGNKVVTWRPKAKARIQRLARKKCGDDFRVSSYYIRPSKMGDINVEGKVGKNKAWIQPISPRVVPSYQVFLGVSDICHV